MLGEQEQAKVGFTQLDTAHSTLALRWGCNEAAVASESLLGGDDM